MTGLFDIFRIHKRRMQRKMIHMLLEQHQTTDTSLKKPVLSFIITSDYSDFNNERNFT